MAKRSSSAFYLLCMALLLALAAGAQAARHDGPDSSPEDDPTFEPAELSAYKSKYKHRYGTSREHYAPDYDHTPHYRGYDREHRHGGYDRPAYKGGDYEGPYYRYRGYDGLSSGPDYYESQEDPSHYPASEGYGEGDGYYHHKKHHYYPKPKDCDVCPKNTSECPTANGGKQCLDTVNSPFSCGDCTTICPANAACLNGTCTCDDGFTECGGVCVDLTTDINFCGSCNNACNSTQFCVNSTCSDTNPCGNLTACFPSPSSNGTCTDLQNDPEACGSCNRRCSILTGDTCTDGKCCVGTDGECRLGFQCCGWNPLSLLPPIGNIVIGTAKCEATNNLFPFIPGRCCQGVVAPCSANSDCCDELICRDFGLLGGEQCQPASCTAPGDACNNNNPCCPGFTCRNLGIFLGSRCSPL